MEAMHAATRKHFEWVEKLFSAAQDVAIFKRLNVKPTMKPLYLPGIGPRLFPGDFIATLSGPKVFPLKVPWSVGEVGETRPVIDVLRREFDCFQKMMLGERLAQALEKIGVRNDADIGKLIYRDGKVVEAIINCLRIFLRDFFYSEIVNK